MQNSLLTTQEFAQAVRLTVSSVQKLCRDGKIVARKTPPHGHWRIPASELLAWQLGFGGKEGQEVRHG